MSSQHFLSLLDFTPGELHDLIQRAIEVKQNLKKGISNRPLEGKTLAMIFEKSSTRTRVSFETGMTQLGGHALFLASHDSQLGRGEAIADSAKVISSMVDGIMIRTFDHARVKQFSHHSSAPVINGLTDLLHPCQLLADMQTWFEMRGSIKGASVAWVGDGNNMCHSYINAARQFDFKLNIACPEGYEPLAEVADPAGDRINIVRTSEEACKDADLIVTDVWASMGQEEEQKLRKADFKAIHVNQHALHVADKDALFMHCLPAHRGEEVSAEVIDGRQSVVWQEAENRLHAQKALLEKLMAPKFAA